MRYRFLRHEDFPELYAAFAKAFSDYTVRMQPTEAQFQEMLARRGIRYDLSVGAFEGDEMAGFNMNALDRWRGRLTVYDLGTGVVAGHRGRGVAGEMFKFTLDRLKQVSAEQYLLEVIRTNSPAIKAYRKLGFLESRRLECFRLSDEAKAGRAERSAEIELSVEGEPDWEQLRSFWDWEPSWQNSINSIERSRDKHALAFARVGSALAGYGIVYPSSGDIPQLAVKREYRRMGVGSRILERLLSEIEPGQSARMINIDESAEATLAFCESAGMEKFVDQYEMILELD